MDLILYIPTKMANKVTYLLKTFKGSEWSGPAWYSMKACEDGTLDSLTLEYFHPLHLGTASSTDWEGKELIKIYKKLQKQYPKIGKKWVQGNIHSHHGMGAFFSGTDNEQLMDGANPNIYASLVVSTKPGKELAFAISYPDQFGIIHKVEIDDIQIKGKVKELPEWVEQVKYIKELKKKEPTVKRYPLAKAYYGGLTDQASLFSDEYAASYGGAVDVETAGKKAMEKDEIYQEIWEDYDDNLITVKVRDERLKKLGVDEYGTMLGY